MRCTGLCTIVLTKQHHLLYKAAVFFVCLYPPPFFYTRPSDRSQIWHTYSGTYGTHSQLTKIDPPHPRGNITSFVTSSKVEDVRHLKTTVRRSMMWYYVMLAEGGRGPGEEGGARAKREGGLEGGREPELRSGPSLPPLPSLPPFPPSPSFPSLPLPPSIPLSPLPLSPPPPSIPSLPLPSEAG